MRPADWSPVGWDRDPTPGDPDAVAALAKRYRDTAEAVRKAAEGLKALAKAESYDGKGGDALRERAVDVEKAVRGVGERYASAADALDRYHPEQHAAQREADAALARAVEARALATSARRRTASLPPPATGEEEEAWVTQARARAEADEAFAEQQLALAVSAAGSAHGRQERAGTAAATALEEAFRKDGVDDTWRDEVASVAKAVASVASAAAGIVGLCALVAALIPGIGPALAGILGTIALVLTVVSLLANVTLMLIGRGDGKALLMDVFSIATLGVGRALVGAGRLAAVAARGRAIQHAKTVVTGNSNQRYQRVRQLVGGPYRKAHEAVPLATARGLARTGARSALPAPLGRRLFGAAPEFKGPAASPHTFGVKLGNLLGDSDDLRALKDIDESIRSADAVRRHITTAHVLSRASAVPTAIGTVTDALSNDKTRQDLLAHVRGPLVDPPAAPAALQQSGLPAGFQEPSPSLPERPAGVR